MHDIVIKGGSVVDGTGRPMFTADIAVADGRIAAIGRVDGPAKTTIDARGALVTPGWIDCHTHYDGQVTWDDQLEGSTANGVSTVVIGNCGVGFAPVRADGVDTLIDLMEGVEDIPGTALYEGIPWGEWESFPEYLDFLKKRTYAADVAAQLPHGAARYFVMGDRAVRNEDATADDLAALSALAEDAIRAGAVGFSSSRIQAHRSTSLGFPVPGTFAPEAEIAAIAEGMARAGGGVFQVIPSGAVGDVPGMERETQSFADEIALFARVSRDTGLRITFTTSQTNDLPTGWRDALDQAAAENGTGAQLFPQVAPRGVGTLTSLSAYHMFMGRPTYHEIAALPVEERVREMRRAEVKEAILGERQVLDADRPGAKFNVLPRLFERDLHKTFPMREPLDYEPDPTTSIAGLAAAAGRDAAEYMYDQLLEEEGAAVCYIPTMNYVDGNLDACLEMLRDPNTVIGLSDAGAHVNYVCDMSNTTFLLTHWVRDRRRGPRLPVEAVVAKATADTARLWGMTDRGVLRVGMRADINVIDLPNLRILRPEVRHDLPAGGRRFLQLAEGYLACVVGGVLTRLKDEDTGARPGRFVGSFG